ncbi:MAG: ribonuclease H family protein [Acidimicrobiales bacterium]
MEPRTIVYTDGACSGNPGPGGWAWVVPDGEFAAGFDAESTNQRMELTAALEAIRALPGPLEIISDSTYVVNCFRDGWWKGWLARGWKTSAKKPVANRDLWEPLVELVVDGDVEFTWVKGHSGDEWNDVADRLAVEAVARRDGRRGSGPAEPLEQPEQPVKHTGQGRLDAPAGHLVVVLGHRPPDIGGYEANPVADRIRRRLQDILAAKALMNDDLVVLSGLRLGVEILAAEAALAETIPLVAVLPYPDPQRVWPPEAQERFATLSEAAREVRTLQNKQPVDRADAAKALGRRDAWFGRVADEAVVVWDGVDPALGALVKKLEAKVGDDVWVVDPAEC